MRYLVTMRETVSARVVFAHLFNLANVYTYSQRVTLLATPDATKVGNYTLTVEPVLDDEVFLADPHMD